MNDRVPNSTGETTASGATIGLLLADCFGNPSVSNRLAESLQDAFPDMVFLRACIRCGSGLFVTSNLFKPGPSSLTLVSLRKSLCGMAMNRCRPIMVRAGNDSIHVCCAPITVAPPNGTTYAPLQVGALMGGVTASEAWSTQDYFLQLASACGPAFLNVALANVERFSHFLSLRDSDAQSLEVEEEYQDLPSDLSAYPTETEFDVQGPAEVEAVRQSTSSNQSSRDLLP